MFTRRFALVATLAVIGAVLTSSSTDARGYLNTANHLTFKTPVRLPGVVLLPGSYAFESGPLGSNPAVVRVTSVDYERVFYTGLTQSTLRPLGMARGEAVAFREAPTGSPRPIAMWFPLGSRNGHTFIYR